MTRACPRVTSGAASTAAPNLQILLDKQTTRRAMNPPTELQLIWSTRVPARSKPMHRVIGCHPSEDYRARLEQHGITCSMSRRGNCYDNAVMESWFSTVNSEEGERFESYSHARLAFG